jgi:hypothetical protein
MVPNGDYYQCKHVKSMTAGRCFECLEEKSAAATPTTSDSEAEELNQLYAEFCTFVEEDIDPHVSKIFKEKLLKWHQRGLAQAEIKGAIAELTPVKCHMSEHLLVTKVGMEHMTKSERLDELQAQLKAAEKAKPSEN